MNDASFAAALDKLAALTPDKARQAERIQQAAMLEAACAPYALVPVLCKIAARGQLLAEDLAAIERIGIELRIDRLPPELPDPAETDGRHDDGEVILGELTIREHPRQRRGSRPHPHQRRALMVGRHRHAVRRQPQHRPDLRRGRDMILTCHEEIADDDGMLAPCDQHAVAYRYDPEHIDRAPYPVCVEHVRAPMAVVRRSDDVKLDALVDVALIPPTAKAGGFLTQTARSPGGGQVLRRQHQQG